MTVDQAEIHRKAVSGKIKERKRAVKQLRRNFANLPDKEEAWEDLIQLTHDKDRYVRRHVADALGTIFPHVPDTRQAWEDLIRLTGNEDSSMQLRAADVLGTTFQHVPDKEQAGEDLIWLTGDESSYVRKGAADALGSAFQHVPEKERAWEDLIRLTGDEDWNVRASANHSLGRAAIFKATGAETEEEFRKEIENALTFFERSSNEVGYFNPSKFCLPFYRLFHAITFEGAGVDKVQKYLADAKSASKGSGSKETLLKAVENLTNALTEAQKAGGTDFDTIKSDLNAYRQYCERAADLISSAEEKTPGAVQVLRRGLSRLPTIDWKLKEPLEEVKKKSEIVCKTAAPSESELGCRITLMTLRDTHEHENVARMP